MTPEEQAQVLSRWLESPAGTNPPGDLDPDVVESMYALRPDLAPMARVSADDILASLTAGPLADPAAVAAAVDNQGEGAEIVAFPSIEAFETVAPVTTASRRNWWTAANQWGGISAVVATAATLILIALPVLQMSEDSGPAASATAPMGEDAEVREQAPAVAEAQSVKQDRAAAAPPADLAAAPARKAEARQGNEDDSLKIIRGNRGDIEGIEEAELDAVADLGELGYVDEKEGYVDMGGGEQLRDQVAMIPEAQAAASQPYAGEPAPAYEMDDFEDLPEAEEGEYGNTGGLTRSGKQRQKKASGDELVDLTSLRAAGNPGGIGDGWRGDLDPDTLANIDRAIAAAKAASQRGKYKDAGDMLAEYITMPPSAGQAQAIAAAEYYLKANHNAGAMSAVSRGLALSSENTAARSMLKVLYGDVLQRTGEYGQAEAAYQDAVEMNAAR